MVRPRLIPASCALGAVAALAACSDNHAPVPATDRVTVPEDTSVAIDVLGNDVDPDGDSLHLTIATVETGGHQVSVEDGKLRLTPEPDASGLVRIYYGVSDGDEAATGTVDVTITPVADDPVALAASLTTPRDTPLAFTLRGQDADGDTLTFAVTTPPAHGAVTGEAPSLVYTPDANYDGPDRLEFRVSDGAGSASETVTIVVGSARPGIPYGRFARVATAEDGPVAITLTGEDPDGDALTFAIAQPPAHGTLSGTAPELVYTPDRNFGGEDVFQFVVSDGQHTSSPTNVSIHVQPVNDAPTASPVAVEVTEDQTTSFQLLGSDPDSSYVRYEVVTAPMRGRVYCHDEGDCNYYPDQDVYGADSFTYQITDGLRAATATVSITIAPVNDAPVAQSRTVTTGEDRAVSIVLTGTDVDGDHLGFATASAPLHGTLAGTAPDLVYTPAANYVGTDSFTFAVGDTHTTSGPATITIQVASANDAPVATPGAVTTAEDQPVSVTLAGTDIDGDALGYSIIAAPAHGTLDGTGRNLTYTPARDYHGPDQLTFQVSDGLATASAVVAIAISPVSDPPIARDDAAIAAAGTAVTIDVTHNDVHPDGTAFAVDHASTPAHGTVTIDGDDVIYTPAAGFTDSDAFTYTLVDADGATATATVRVGIDRFPSNVPMQLVGSVGSDRNQWPAVSRDGRFIAFQSSGPLVADDRNGTSDVFVYDRVADAIERVSLSSTGAEGDGFSVVGGISADGRYIAFASEATNLVAGDSNGVMDVFVRDRVAGTTVRVSVGTDGRQPSAFCAGATISDDGRYVAFISRAFELIADDANGADDIFVRDVVAGTTIRASVPNAGGEADLGSPWGMISGDGRVIAFQSVATNLVAGDLNAKSDVFVRDLIAGTTERVSVTSIGGEGNDASNLPSISRDGRFVSFLSNATNLVPGIGNNLARVYVRDRQGATTTQPITTAALRYARISPDGRYLVANTSSASFLRDRFAAVTSAMPSGAAQPVFSGNGRYIVLVSAASLVPSTPVGSSVYVMPNAL